MFNRHQSECFRYLGCLVIPLGHGYSITKLLLSLIYTSVYTHMYNEYTTSWPTCKTQYKFFPSLHFMYDVLIMMMMMVMIIMMLVVIVWYDTYRWLSTRMQ